MVSQTAHPHLGSIVDVIDETRHIAQSHERVAINDILTSLGRVSQSAMLMVPALIVATPLSGIPGLSSVGGITIALISGQLMLGRRKLWLPKWLRNLTIAGDKLDRSLARAVKTAAWVDRFTERRAVMMFRFPMLGLIHLFCFLCGAAMPFLELVPMTSSLLAIAVCFFSLAMLARDGLFALAGLAFMGSAVGLLVSFLAG